ncbi:hypothetical protein [Micromonospora costi]|uniref:DUF5666 domain-containing protein n=1 Tax=Micromonospora costi TaxID=1530042 RepID=A0A3A9ZTG6_9ACTN|nr:hypothetical protein [Micromonospora costi]RKN51535.1 hypothetical protein D7193_29730 [Micromonospora costi]
MARWGIAGGTALLAAVTLGVSGCAAGAADQPAREAAVEVAAAMGAEGQALTAMGFDPGDLDVVDVAAPASPSAAPTAKGDKPRREKAEQARERRKARVLLRRNTLHGEAVVQTKDGGTKTVVVQRGEVTAIDGDSMTVKSTDGFSMTWRFGDDLRVIERRTSIQPSEVKVGTKLGVAGERNGETPVARVTVIPRP